MSSLKKTFSFSTPEGKELVDAAFALESRCTGYTISGLFERDLMLAILPDKQIYSEWIQRLILNEWNIGDTVSAWATHLASDPTTANNEFIPIMEFCKLFSSVTTNFSDQNAVDNFRVHATRLLDLMKNGAGDRYDPTWLSLETKRISGILSELDCNSPIDTKYFFELLSAYSALFKNAECAYHLTACIARSCEWDDSPYTQFKLWSLLRTLGNVTPIHH